MNAQPPTPPPAPDARAPGAALQAPGRPERSDRPHPRHGWRGWALGVAVLVGMLVVAIGVCEWLGWPFLRRPAEQWLSQKLDRMVTFEGDADGRGAWQLRVIGHLRLRTHALTVAGPSWSTLGSPTVQATDAALVLRYGDLLALRDGGALRVKSLRADDLTLRLERDVEGRASWQFGEQSDSSSQIRRRPAVDGVRFDLLEVRNGTALVDDKIERASLLARFALRESWSTADRAALAQGGRDGAAAASAPTREARTAGADATAKISGSATLGARAASAAASGTRLAVDFGERLAGKPRGASDAGEPGPGEGGRYGVTAHAEGHYRNLPVQASLQTGSALPWLSSDPNAPAVPVTLRGNIGKAELSFDGTVRDLIGSQGLSGRYKLSGPSLAAVGEPLGITLPTTPAFAMQGQLSRDGTRWKTAVSQATIGRSHLSGDFEFDHPPRALPRLTGQLRGSVLWLADLGPAVGVPAEPAARKAAVRGNARVLPDKQFDLPSLRAMNADVDVKLARFESGTALLQAAEPLNARIVLQDGVLRIQNIDARVAKGQFAGLVQLDGREPRAKWEVRLRVSGVRLEQWLKLQRKDNQPPYVTGVMGGRIALDGTGRSTAELLASADGRMVLYWTDGTVSHLMVEAAGLDIAQGLGMLIRGDDSLKVSCGVADLRVKDGAVTPKPFVVDTSDSLVLMEGGMSLATERLALKARVEPKDKTPLSLRTPLHIDGTLGDPRISLEKGPLLKRLVPAAVLGVAVAPLAAIVPLIDLGEDPDDESRAALSECNARLAPVTKRRAGS
ncbi:AsmA family protein [Roseateles chitosanitabidus]|uniref:AsmA family protein n=1 Tax=Roseateles chitosanitabidus TaxID=65048 RepID=UPI00083446BA|nr:AsmA family protein [Roseateles chitosanitabidus]